MALRDKLRTRCRPFLEPGEQVRHVWFCQAGMTPYLVFVLIVPAVTAPVLFGVLPGAVVIALGAAVAGSLALLCFEPRVVCVTDRSVVVLRSSRWIYSLPQQGLRRLPRDTVFGPMTGLWGQTHATGEKLHIHTRFHKDVRAADAELAMQRPAQAAGYAPQPATSPGWYPDPSQPGRQRWHDGANWTAHVS